MNKDYAALLDIEAIKKLRILYSHLLDTKDLDKLTELFTEDAVCNFGGGRGVWTGRDEFDAIGPRFTRNLIRTARVATHFCIQLPTTGSN